MAALEHDKFARVIPAFETDCVAAACARLSDELGTGCEEGEDWPKRGSVPLVSYLSVSRAETASWVHC